MEQEYISMDEAGRVLCASRSTIYRMIAAQQLVSKSFGRRRVISTESIKAFQDAAPTTGAMAA
jgi:excisionase family DNA binding protein